MTKMISYAHKADPKGTRFNDIKGNKPPAWAVDVQDVDTFLNAYGLTVHQTDRFVHWKEHEPLVKMNKMREIYNKIIDAGVTSKELDVMLEFAYDSGLADQADYDNQDL